MSGPKDRPFGSGFPFEIVKQVSGPASLLGKTFWRSGLSDNTQITVTQMIGKESGTIINLVQESGGRTIGAQVVKPGAKG
jgi:hypothetical protein